MLVDAVRADGVLMVTLRRPEKRNALSRDLAAEMSGVFARHADDPDLKLAVLTGEGDKAFASGGDLKELSAVRSLADAEAMALSFRQALDAVRRFPLPVIAAVNGDALGGGAELAMACDMRIAAAHARIGFLQGRLNISTAWGGGIDLIRAVGVGPALRLLGEAEILTADEAVQAGLVEAVAPAGQAFAEFVDLQVAGFRRRTPAVMRAFKGVAGAMRFGAAHADAVAAETALFARTWVHDDHWTAVEASLGRAGRA